MPQGESVSTIILKLNLNEAAEAHEFCRLALERAPGSAEKEAGERFYSVRRKLYRKLCDAEIMSAEDVEAAAYFLRDKLRAMPRDGVPEDRQVKSLATLADKIASWTWRGRTAAAA